MIPHTHHKTGFGLIDTRNAIADRIRRERDLAENPPRRRPKTGGELLAEMEAGLPPRPWFRTEIRPLAA